MARIFMHAKVARHISDLKIQYATGVVLLTQDKQSYK